MYVDKLNITVTGGKGGSGIASFRREKYLPFGGPDGGDGGKGGDVYIQVDNNLNDLAYFKNQRQFIAMSGGPGEKNKKHGKDAPDMIINVPRGTHVIVYNGKKVEKELDLIKEGQKILVARGGKGGKGNVHFASPTHKAPREFQMGQNGETRTLLLDMHLPVDVCIIGAPNSGKSSLLNAISNANTRVADYAFTTREPVMGLVDDGYMRAVWSEIPALIPGSHEGKGLGNRFLKHLYRACVIIYLLDASSEQIAEDISYLRKEVDSFNGEFRLKKYIIAINKIDLLKDLDAYKRNLYQQLPDEDERIFMISVKTAVGLNEMISYVNKIIMEEKSAEPGKYSDYVIFRPGMCDRRGDL